MADFWKAHRDADAAGFSKDGWTYKASAGTMSIRVHTHQHDSYGVPNSACDVGLPLELTSGLGRDRGESGGLRGVLVAPARHREKLGCLFMGIVGSGCARSRIVGLGLIGSERWISRGLEGSQCRIVRLREDLWSFGQLRHWADQVRRG